MFIETLEFTIPIDLCDLFSTLKRGPRSNLEFPASVNSYGTTQDANIQVALRSNKLTFKVDGVSSNSSMISKSECKTLKLSVFDVDCSLSGAEYEQVTQMVSQPIYSSPHVAPVKRSRDRPSPMKSPPSKTSRSSFQETKHQDIPQPSPDPLQSKSESETVSVKLEPDLIEIEPDSEQFGDESNQSVDRRHNTQAALDRLSHPQSSHSQSSASSSSSFHQNVPHVPDYAEPSTSQGDQHGDQNIDDYVVYQQEDDDYGEDNDNSADFGNDDLSSNGGFVGVDHPKNDFLHGFGKQLNTPIFISSLTGDRFHHASRGRSKPGSASRPFSGFSPNAGTVVDVSGSYACPYCDKMFAGKGSRWNHIHAIHNKVSHSCVCGKVYQYSGGLQRHKKICSSWALQLMESQSASNLVGSQSVANLGGSQSASDLVGSQSASDVRASPASHPLDSQSAPHVTDSPSALSDTDSKDVKTENDT
ncbi:serine-rich adhesin for platelets-like isoform X4 [Haliotis asinina]|uniref:serine-rich adhesin for platelets-like isoform X4 n=1 Tax=Haliotis asinina TaxID=109174 RepID=UPI00353231F1